MPPKFCTNGVGDKHSAETWRFGRCRGEMDERKFVFALGDDSAMPATLFRRCTSSLPAEKFCQSFGNAAGDTTKTLDRRCL